MNAMQRQMIHSGDLIIQQGDPGNKFYILEEGDTEVVEKRARAFSLIALDPRPISFPKNLLNSGQVSFLEPEIIFINKNCKKPENLQMFPPCPVSQKLNSEVFLCTFEHSSFSI